MPQKHHSTSSTRKSKGSKSKHSTRPGTNSSRVNNQNSDLEHGAHSSGARIEDMYRNVRPGEPEEVEIVRPSERENRYQSPEEPAEGSRDDV